MMSPSYVPQVQPTRSGEPAALWMAALIRASQELLDAYLVAGAPAREGEGGQPARWVRSTLIGATTGEVRCRIEPALAAALAEGMWGEPRDQLDAAQVDDALREFCGQIIGYAAGEVSTQIPGVFFAPPSSLPAGPEGALEDGDEAVVPVRAGSLRWQLGPIHLAREGAPAPQATQVRERIRGLRDTDLQLLQAQRVLGIDETADDAFEELLKLVGGDPGLSARILRRVNSAAVRPRGARLQTLPQALLYLGTRAAKNIVISALLAQPSGGAPPVRPDIIHHSLQVAIAARHLGMLAGLDGDGCYLLGLLHDLGRLVLDRLYPEIMGGLTGREEEVLAQEAQAIGVTHAEAGAILAAAWRFPESLRLAMAAHHDWRFAGSLGLPAEEALQLQVVALADRLAEAWGPAGPPADLGPAAAEVARVLAGDEAAVRACLAAMAEQLREDLRTEDLGDEAR